MTSWGPEAGAIEEWSHDPRRYSGLFFVFIGRDRAEKDADIDGFVDFSIYGQQPTTCRGRNIEGDLAGRQLDQSVPFHDDIPFADQPATNCQDVVTGKP